MLHLRPVLAFILLKGKGGRDCHGFLFARRSPFPPETTAVASSTPEHRVIPFSVFGLRFSVKINKIYQ